MTDQPSAKLDPRTQELIEAEFSERLFINHTEASTLLQVDPSELYRMGDDGEIEYQIKGSKRRRYTRTHIKACVARGREHSDTLLEDNAGVRKREQSDSAAHRKLRERLDGMKRTAGSSARESRPALRIELDLMRTRKELKRLEKEARLRKQTTKP